MEFLDPSKKRAHNIRLFIGYFLVGIAIVIAATILLFQANGYDINRNNGEVIQNGLIFVDSNPVSADITLNGQPQGQTSKRLAVPAGKYTVNLQKQGYRPWSRTFNLSGGSVLQLVYPLLFPTKLVLSNVAQYNSAPILTTQSPDRRWMLLFKSNLATGFDILDVSKATTKPVAAKYPTNLLSGLSDKSQSLKLVEWSSDNRHVLLKHGFGTKSEFIIIDRINPALSVNINKSLLSSPTNVSLRDKKFNQLYLYSAVTKNLDLANISTIKNVNILKGVISYKAYGPDIIMYTTPGKLKSMTSVKFYENGKSFALHDYPSKHQYALDMAGYNGHDYSTVTSSEGYTYIYKDALDQVKNISKSSVPTPFIALNLGGPAVTSFSVNARFIASQKGNKFSIYDIETTQTYRYTLKQILSSTPAVWMDGHRLVTNTKGTTLVFDYDGINQQLLSPSLPGYKTYFNFDYSGMFNLTNVKSQPKLFTITRTELIAK